MAAQSRLQHERFRVEVHPERTRVRVVPVGELDVATVPELEAQLVELCDAGWRHIALDLRQLEFMDSSGIHLVLSRHVMARENAHDFSLIAGSPAIQRLLEVCGLADVLRIETS